jgi:hypothetical protein
MKNIQVDEIDGSAQPPNQHPKIRGKITITLSA